MEKEFYRESKISQTGIAPETLGSPSKKVKVLRDMDAAIAAFDEEESGDQVIEFIVKKRGPAVLPPIPTDAAVQEQLFKNALLLIDGGEFKLARNVLGSVLQKNNAHVEAIRWMGWCFRQEQDFKNALKYYEQLIQLRVTDQDLFELGEIYYSLKQDTEAQSTWMDALGQCDAESPRLFDLHKNLGNVYNRLGDHDGAEENYNKALVLRPHSDVIQVNLGSLNFQRQNYKNALEAFKRAVEINPANDRGWCGVALVAREMKDEEWARGVLLKALDLNPLNQTALHVLTNWAQQDLQWDDAITRVNHYVEQVPGDVDMTYALAGLHFQKGSLSDSELQLKKIELMDPLRPEVAELRELIRQKAQQEL